MSTAPSTVCRRMASRDWRTSAWRSSISPGLPRWPGPPRRHSETNREVYRIAAAAPYLQADCRRALRALEEGSDVRAEPDPDLGAPQDRQDRRGRIFPALRALACRPG